MTLDQPISRFRTSHGIYAMLIAANIFMGATVLEQGRVIETQRVLIKNLFFDTTHTAALRLKEALAVRK